MAICLNYSMPARPTTTYHTRTWLLGYTTAHNSYSKGQGFIRKYRHTWAPRAQNSEVVIIDIVLLSRPNEQIHTLQITYFQEYHLITILLTANTPLLLTSGHPKFSQWKKSHVKYIHAIGRILSYVGMYMYMCKYKSIM